MKIQVLGSGCPTCAKLYAVVKKVVEEMNIQQEVEYLTGSEGSQKIIELGILRSPVLVIDNEVAMVGFTSDTEKIQTMIQRALSR